MPEDQPDLFGRSAVVPPGFRYRPDLIGRDDERELIEAVRRLNFAPFDFHGFLGKRQVVSFGWRYDFNGGGLRKTEDLPAFLLPLRNAAAAFADLDPAALQQVLLTEYPTGATIGWHKDKSVFGEVVGVSLLSACTLRFRRRVPPTWERASVVVDRRSAYLLRGPSRTEWEHSIPAVAEPRYSITFRSLSDAER